MLALLAPGNMRMAEIKAVEMLGHDGDLQWEQHPDGLLVKISKVRPCEFAHRLKIHLPRK